MMSSKISYKERLEKEIKFLSPEKREEIRLVYNESIEEMDIRPDDYTAIVNALGEPNQFVEEFIEMRYDQSNQVQIKLPATLQQLNLSFNRVLRPGKNPYFMKTDSSLRLAVFLLPLAISLVMTLVDIFVPWPSVYTSFVVWQNFVFIYAVYMVLSTFTGQYLTTTREDNLLTNAYRIYFFIYLTLHTPIYIFFERESELEGFFIIVAALIIVEILLIMQRIVYNLPPKELTVNGYNIGLILYVFLFMSILLSGYLEGYESVARLVDQPATEFIQKPFTLDVLKEKIKKVTMNIDI